MSYGAPEGLHAGAVGPGHGEISADGDDLIGRAAQACGEGVSGVAAAGPAAVPGGGDAPGDDVVLADAHVGE